MTIAASVREPAASMVTLAVAVAASASTSAASSAYSDFDMIVVLWPTPTGTQGGLEVMDPAINAAVEKIPPPEFSSGDVEWLGECHRATGVSEAHYSGGCRKDSLHNATHLSTDTRLCESVVQEHLNMCRTPHCSQ